MAFIIQFLTLSYTSIQLDLLFEYVEITVFS